MAIICSHSSWRKYNFLEKLVTIIDQWIQNNVLATNNAQQRWFLFTSSNISQYYQSMHCNLSMSYQTLLRVSFTEYAVHEQSLYAHVLVRGNH